jgi:hypothetical protein
MIVPFKDRRIEPGQRVEVYLNLHKSEGKIGAIDKPWYSVRCARTGRVLAHADSLVLDDARFVVNAEGRERVRREKRKNVHAWIAGSVSFDQPNMDAGDPLFYDPYRVDRFVVAGTTRVVETAERAHIAGPGVTAVAAA